VFSGYGSIVVKVSHGIEGRASGAPGVAGQPPRLLDKVRERMRRLGLGGRTAVASNSLL